MQHPPAAAASWLKTQGTRQCCSQTRLRDATECNQYVLVSLEVYQWLIWWQEMKHGKFKWLPGFPLKWPSKFRTF